MHCRYGVFAPLKEFFSVRPISDPEKHRYMHGSKENFRGKNSTRTKRPNFLQVTEKFHEFDLVKNLRSIQR